ncbi:MAG: hypothetical protein EA417_10200 [Gammaproteobacteria bacterium]|nr:MAG: hypothetical protein EA417_10200 [Gammaproteobacteria bacterium]
MTRMMACIATAWLLAGCASPQPDGPSEPAPEPPAMGAPSTMDAPMDWICADDTRVTTRYLASRDQLELTLAGRTRLLARIRRTPSAAWGDADVSFGMEEAGGALLRWEGESVRCERDAPPDK